MPIKKDKRKKRKITLLKQKQTQTQKVVINLADLVKRRPRAKPLVEPIPKKPSEMILTRVIREPAFTPPYQHHINEPVKVSHAGLEQPKYIPETYKPEMNRELLEKMGQQPIPFQREVEETQSPFLTTEVDTRQSRQPRRRQDDPTLIEEKELKALRKRIKEEEMERRRENERELMKLGGYKSQDDERPPIPTTTEGFRKLETDYKSKDK